VNEPVFYKAAPAHASISIVAAAPFPQVFVALGTVGYLARAVMHYVPELRRSVPHTKPNCQWCRFPGVPKTWFPVQQCPWHFGREIMSEPLLKKLPKALPHDSTWPCKVLEIPPSAAALIAQLEPGKVFAVVRGLGNQQKKVGFRVFPQTIENVLPAFDTIPYLRKAWGLMPLSGLFGN